MLAKKITTPTGHIHKVTSRPELGSHVRLLDSHDLDRGNGKVRAQGIYQDRARGHTSSVSQFDSVVYN